MFQKKQIALQTKHHVSIINTISEIKTHPLYQFAKERIEISDLIFGLKDQSQLLHVLLAIKDFVKKDKYNINYVWSFALHFVDITFKNRPLALQLLCSLLLSYPTNNLKRKRMFSFSATFLSFEGYVETVTKPKHPLLLTVHPVNSPLFFLMHDRLEDFKQIIQIRKISLTEPPTVNFEEHSNYFIASVEPSLLDIAAFHGSENCFNFLLCNNITQTINTPFCAVAGGNFQIIRTLLNLGVTFEKTLDTAMYYNQNQIADWIIQNYPNFSIPSLVNMLQAMNEPALYFFLSRGLNPNLKQGEVSLLSLCCQNGYIHIIKYLCEKTKIIKDTLNKDRSTPLHYACCYGYLEIVKYLIEEQHVNPKVINTDGNTPFHAAIEMGHLDIVKYFIETKISDKEERTKNGLTPFLLAIGHNLIEIMKYLIEELHVNINATFQGLNALQLACYFNSYDACRYLVDTLKFDITKKSEQGESLILL